MDVVDEERVGRLDTNKDRVMVSGFRIFRHKISLSITLSSSSLDNLPIEYSGESAISPEPL
jgi:hypothetical protein